MNPTHERLNLEAIEAHALLGEHESAKRLGDTYNKERQKNRKERKILARKNQVFEGTVVAVGWDESDHVIQSSLYTQDDEDLLLDHGTGVRKFIPHLNKKVRVWGDIVSSDWEEKKILVRKISRLSEGFTKPSEALHDEFDNLIK